MTTTEWRTEATARDAASRTRGRSIALPGPPMLYPVLASIVLYFGLFLLLRGRSFRLTQTLTLQRWTWLGRISDALTPESLATATWRSDQAAVHQLLYGLVAIALVAAWVAMLWLSRPGGHRVPLRWILVVACLFSVPLILLPGMFSGDLYLYMFYGRMIARYGSNPIIDAPELFRSDPHLQWVYWKSLPSAYGPVWLMFSGVLSAIAGSALFANVFTYKVGVLALHLLTTVAVWATVRELKPELASWSAIFYGWNPLVLFETAGSGHNDVMLAAFVTLALLAAARERWLYAVFFVVAAVMVKLSALILLPILLLVWLLGLGTMRERAVALVSGCAVAVIAAAVLHAPLWAGTQLLENVRENPASKWYLNSLWEMRADMIETPNNQREWVRITEGMDTPRNLVLVLGLAVVLYMVWRRRGLAENWVWLWFLFSLSLAWIWPWYFVLLMPIAAVCGPSREAALAVGLTLGGMLFWLGWPNPPLPAATWLYHYRAALMFAPALLVAALPVLSRWVESAIGAAQEESDAPLSTTAGP